MTQVRLWLGLNLAGATMTMTGSAAEGPVWSEVLREVRGRFPSVTQVSTHQVAEWLGDGKRRPPHVVDTRAAEEFEVSRLPGARRASSVAEFRALGIPRDEPVVVYCSVGYRSSALAERLRGQGWSQVMNMEGSIFAWANEGRAVVGSNGMATGVVHPYNARWGVLLDARWHPKPKGPKRAEGNSLE
jgi:rhodanese-related sulfurtransferase